MPRRESVTKKLLKNAISGSYGEINAIARKAGCNVRTVARKLEQYPELKKLIEHEKSILRVTQVELAKNTILEALQRREDETDRDKDRRVKVSMWVMERLGVDEGYNPTVKVEAEQKSVTRVYIDDLGKTDNEAGNSQP
nr:MAG TPA: DNA-binding protein [Caudoviricetes sp.]